MDFNYLMGAFTGIAGTVISGLAINLLTPSVSNFLAERSARFKQRRAERILERYKKIKQMKGDRAEFQVFLTMTLLRIVALLAVGGVVYLYAGVTNQLMAWLFGPAIRHPAIAESLASFQSTTSTVAFTVCLGTVLICKSVFDVDQRIRNFEAYEADVMRQLNSEQLASLGLDGTS